MDNNKDRGKASKYINWITVWGFIFGCIAFNLYVDNRQNQRAQLESRVQYEFESQRADSLYKETIRLEHRLQEMEARTEKLSTNQPIHSSNPVLASEL